jgi:hypothetical protein
VILVVVACDVVFGCASLVLRRNAGWCIEREDAALLAEAGSW